MLVSKLRWFAKEQARIQSVISKQGHKTSKKLHRLIVKEHAHVNDYQSNEKLHRIPFGRLVKLIRYKAEEYGIKIGAVDEAYTSQMCSVCGLVDKSSRRYRGLYVCKHWGTVLNTDVNGARNILFRVISNPVRDSGFGHPRRIRVLQAPNFV